MNSNIAEFIKTRKFWQPLISLVLTLLIWGLPEVVGIDITQEMLSMITVVMWIIASLIVYWDIRFDWVSVGVTLPPRS